MAWIKGYLETTLLFWKDREKVSVEQIAILPSIFASVFYVLFIKLSGRSAPELSLAQLIFPVLLAFVISYYLFGHGKFLLAMNFLKFIRAFTLHSMLTLLIFTSIVSIKSLLNQQRLLIGCICASILLGYHTYKLHPICDIGRFLYFLQLLLAMILFSATVGIFLYYCAIPSQSG